MIKKILYRLKRRELIKAIRLKFFRKKYAYNSKLTDVEYLSKFTKISLEYKTNLIEPKSFNEKINWYKLNYTNDLMSKVVDKISAKEYVKSKGLEEIIIPTIKIYNSIDDLDLNELPNEFIVKNTADSGGVFVCDDKAKLNINKVKIKFKKQINSQIYNGIHHLREHPYENVKNKIIVEELIKTSHKGAPYDYKFFCFNGKPEFLYVCTEREKDVKFDFFDIDWNWLDVKQGHKNAKVHPKKPENYEKMLEICQILSKDFPFVRVDLYNENGKIYFGELTFYHMGGIVKFEPKCWDFEFGKYFDIEKINKN